MLQKVLASRKELLEYDRREHDSHGGVCVTPTPSPRASSSKFALSPGTPGPSLSRSLSVLSGIKAIAGCYGCASAATEHCVTLLRALAMVPSTREMLVEEVRN